MNCESGGLPQGFAVMPDRSVMQDPMPAGGLLRERIPQFGRMPVVPRRRIAGKQIVPVIGMGQQRAGCKNDCRDSNEFFHGSI
ncbi:MAG TPA: hypothetical protein VIE65_03495, partial [Methylobacter sp.]